MNCLQIFCFAILTCMYLIFLFHPTYSILHILSYIPKILIFPIHRKKPPSPPKTPPSPGPFTPKKPPALFKYFFFQTFSPNKKSKSKSKSKQNKNVHSPKHPHHRLFPFHIPHLFHLFDLFDLFYLYYYYYNQLRSYLSATTTKTRRPKTYLGM